MAITRITSANIADGTITNADKCVHAMLDGDLDELQAKRQEVKARFPK